MRGHLIHAGQDLRHLNAQPSTLIGKALNDNCGVDVSHAQTPKYRWRISAASLNWPLLPAHTVRPFSITK